MGHSIAEAIELTQKEGMAMRNKWMERTNERMNKPTNKLPLKPTSRNQRMERTNKPNAVKTHLAKGPNLILEINARLVSELLDGFLPKRGNVSSVFHVLPDDKFHLDQDENSFEVAPNRPADDQSEAPPAEHQRRRRKGRRRQRRRLSGAKNGAVIDVPRSN